MKHIKFLTPAEMNTAIVSQRAALAAIQTTLEQKLSTGPAAAQAKRLVAMGLAKQAAHLLEQLANNSQYLNTKAAADSAEELPKESADNGLHGVVVEVATEAAAILAEMLSVDVAALAPFLVECNSIMLSVSDDLIKQAEGKLLEAEVMAIDI